MKRVLVIGAGGSGKTTLARRLAERTGLPLIHLDQHYWSAGWVPTPAEDWRERVEKLAAEDRWLRRRLTYRGRSRRDLPPGCPERLTGEFIAWVWSYPQRRRSDVLERLAAIDGCTRAVILRSSKSVERFLTGIPQAETRKAGVPQSGRDS